MGLREVELWSMMWVGVICRPMFDWFSSVGAVAVMGSQGSFGRLQVAGDLARSLCRFSLMQVVAQVSLCDDDGTWGELE